MKLYELRIETTEEGAPECDRPNEPLIKIVQGDDVVLIHPDQIEPVMKNLRIKAQECFRVKFQRSKANA